MCSATTTGRSSSGLSMILTSRRKRSAKTRLEQELRFESCEYNIFRNHVLAFLGAHGILGNIFCILGLSGRLMPLISYQTN
jgi:hypothetical protein